jgi:hypothetical protein
MKTCHGAQYDGGTSGVACTSCHASFPHEVAFASGSVVAAHRDYIQMHLEWDISSCQNCHGTNFGGEGVDEKNCLTCHTDAMGPANCSTCHGGSESSAPPNALSDDPDDPAIGAHAVHVAYSDVYCAECHVVPTSLDSEGHLDGTFPAVAEVVWGSIANQNGTINPTYLGGTCASSYCHGGFIYTKANAPEIAKFIYEGDAITGNDLSMNWNDSAPAQCGSCHGLPPTGHLVLAPEGEPLPCSACHAAVVDENYQIIDETLHVNGQADIQSATVAEYAAMMKR